MSSVLTNVYIDKLDDILNKCNNTYHSKIKMKPADVKASTYIDFKKENNKGDPKFEVGDHVRIWKYKNNLAKGFTPNWSEEVLMIKKIKILFRRHMLLVILTVKKLLERFTKMNCKKQVKKSLLLEK